jgi:switch-associated protein 70
MKTKKMTTTASLMKNVTNSIWHAFDALHQDKLGYVNKSKLKVSLLISKCSYCQYKVPFVSCQVLTANIAVILDLYGVEKGLDHYRSTASLSFEHFKQYLTKEVFAAISNDLTLAQQRGYESKIEEVCWLVCRKNFVETTKHLYSSDCIYKLFRIFCMLSDLHEENAGENKMCRVTLHASEVLHILQQLLQSLGLDYETDNNNKYHDFLNSNLLTKESYTFAEFLQLVQLKDFDLNVKDSVESLQEAVDDMFQTYILDVIKKGFLLRRGFLFPTLREYWFVLQPCELSYYKSSSGKDLCGSIALDSKCMVRPNVPHAKSTGKHDRKIQKFVLSCGDRNFELGTTDHKSRMQWISALQLAITVSAAKDGFQRDLLRRRRKQREIENKRKCEEATKLEEAEKTKAQLEVEKLARRAAESQAKEMQAMAREDSRRVAELEDIKVNLEKLLVEEQQAKRDEEIVRALQARVLAEEWEKREELEQLQAEQRTMLEMERQKRMEFENVQRDKEQQLIDAEKMLKHLEEERQKLDIELQQARQKIQMSEDTKGMFEARLSSLSPVMRGDGEKLRRAQSFMPSTRERPVNLDIRPSSLQRLNKVL